MILIKKVISILLRTAAVLILLVLLAVTVTSISPVYRFKAPEPFSGPDVFDPYRNLDTTHCWKRANFHTHTRVEGILNECELWPADVYKAFEQFGYDIVTFSNHNELTDHPFDPTLQVNVYEHGYNLFKYHKLVFGSEKVNRFDHLLPIFAFQKQFQLDLLGKDSDFIQMNHPLRTHGTSIKQMQKLNGYQIMELDSGRSTENEYWDWALSAGHYSFALANDDLHYPDRTRCIAVRCNFLCTPTATYEDIRKTLLDGCYYSMRVPDYGKGDWEEKISRNKSLPYIEDIGLDKDTIYITLSETADSIKVTGQDHTTLAIATDTDSAAYTIAPDDSYARFTAYFPDGEVIWSNPFARYDSSAADSPFRPSAHTINYPLTILFNLLLLLTAACFLTVIFRIIFRNEKSEK